LYTWGEAAGGALGLGDAFRKALQPMLVRTGLDGVHAARIACGARHCVLVAADGGCFAWGDGTFGCLGLGASVVCATTPRRVAALQGTRAMWPACGAWHSAVVVAAGDGNVDDGDDGDEGWHSGGEAAAFGRVYVWGDNGRGQLGLGADVPRTFTPTALGGALGSMTAVQVECGDTHTAARTADGGVWWWGADGVTASAPLPTRVAALSALVADEVACGGRHTVVLAASRTQLFTWGAGGGGCLGHGNERACASPTPVVELMGRALRSVAAAGRCTVAVCAHQELSRAALRSLQKDADRERKHQRRSLGASASSTDLGGGGSPGASTSRDAKVIGPGAPKAKRTSRGLPLSRNKSGSMHSFKPVVADDEDHSTMLVLSSRRSVPATIAESRRESATESPARGDGGGNSLAKATKRRQLQRRATSALSAFVRSSSSHAALNALAAAHHSASSASLASLASLACSAPATLSSALTAAARAEVEPTGVQSQPSLTSTPSDWTEERVEDSVKPEPVLRSRSVDGASAKPTSPSSLSTWFGKAAGALSGSGSTGAAEAAAAASATAEAMEAMRHELQVARAQVSSAPHCGDPLAGEERVRDARERCEFSAREGTQFRVGRSTVLLKLVAGGEKARKVLPPPPSPAMHHAASCGIMRHHATERQRSHAHERRRSTRASCAWRPAQRRRSCARR
jgi:hypothetical protein